MVLIGAEFFARDTVKVARDLLGKTIRYGKCAGTIVETEAYRNDPASHGACGSPRSRLMRETYGRVYIYLIYGMHHCLNFTSEKEAPGAVLIRALEPTDGIEEMMRRRNTSNEVCLTSGPGKLCQAFGIGMEMLGSAVNEGIQVMEGPAPSRRIESSPRIGISKAKDLPWRFYIAGSPFVSRLR